jgi:hypothetical protein
LFKGIRVRSFTQFKKYINPLLRSHCRARKGIRIVSVCKIGKNPHYFFHNSFSMMPEDDA